ncbi:hypothetical protein FRB99_003864 [Tulasnella sp. 403]|nr:hypothetical protein FRB99_003864 [Tulasnella sp. 403]
MPRLASPNDHRIRQSLAPYLTDSLRSRASPVPTLAARSYASSSSSNSPPVSRRPSPPPATTSGRTVSSKSTPFTAPGELYPYQKGKKVTSAQLAQLLAYFQEDENPSKEQRLVLANRLEMSFKALSIWFQNERANVKKGRSRSHALHAPEASEMANGPLLGSTRPPVAPSRSFSASSSQRTRHDDDRSDYSGDQDDSDGTLELETPQTRASSLPQVRVATVDDDIENLLDEEGMLAASILANMKQAH